MFDLWSLAIDISQESADDEMARLGLQIVNVEVME